MPPGSAAAGPAAFWTLPCPSPGLGVVAICVTAFLGVEYGWFGAPYTPTQPIEGVITQEGYDGDSAVSLPIETGDVSVFVPEEGGFAEYIVHNTPYSPEDILRQMVYLGGAPQEPPCSPPIWTAAARNPAMAAPLHTPWGTPFP